MVRKLLSSSSPYVTNLTIACSYKAVKTSAKTLVQNVTNNNFLNSHFKTELGPVELLAREGTEKVSLGEAPLLTKNYDTIVTLN